MVDYLPYGFGTVDQQVEQSHVVVLRKQFGQKSRPDVARAANHQHPVHGKGRGPLEMDFRTHDVRPEQRPHAREHQDDDAQSPRQHQSAARHIERATEKVRDEPEQQVPETNRLGDNQRLVTALICATASVEPADGKHEQTYAGQQPGNMKIIAYKSPEEIVVGDIGDSGLEGYEVKKPQNEGRQRGRVDKKN